MRTSSRAVRAAVDLTPFGRLFDLDGNGPDVIAEPIEGVRDRYTVEPVVTGAVHVGMTSGRAAPDVARMERHPTTREALLASTSRSSCCPPPIPHPSRRRQLPRVLVRPGECLSLNPGVWHSAAMGLDGPSRYYWLAGVSDSPESPWGEILGGPVQVTVPG